MSDPKACVIGHPVAHSRSPLIHGFWLRELGLPGTYERVDVLPDALAEFLATFSSRGYVGANVTVPHKEAAFRALRHASREARTIGAVNTLWLEAGELKGDNTDVTGFLANLDEAADGWDRRRHRAVVLGAGGSARSIVHGLAVRGFAQIAIVNRSLERAQALVGDVSGTATATAWEARSRALADADLLVNTTSLGMAGQPALDLDLAVLPAHAVVNDIVYVPLETALLARARARNLRVADGLGMLLHQAVPGFTRWFGSRPKVTLALRRAVMADIIAAQ